MSHSLVLATLACSLLVAAGCNMEGVATPSDAGADFAMPPAAAADLALGAQWHSLSAPVDGGASLRGVYATERGAWVVGGSSLVLRYSGDTATIENVAPGHVLRGIAYMRDLFVVGDNGFAMKQSGGGWSDISTGGASLNAVWATDPSVIVATGARGTVGIWTVAGWRFQNLATTPDLYSLWVRVADMDGEIYVVGAAGTVQRGSLPYQTAFAALDAGTTADLFGVWAETAQVFIVGGGGIILHSVDGVSFAPESSGTTAVLYGVSSAGGELWAVGAGGTVLHRHAGTWLVERTGGPDLRAVWAVSASEAWAVGDGTTVLHYY